MPRTIIVGDVHGMLAELEQLLERVDCRPADQLIFCGDLLDKGPHSAEVVRFVRKFSACGKPPLLVRGNHEERHERYRLKQASQGGAPKMKGIEELERITAQLDKGDVAYLATARNYITLPKHKALVVHAGISPLMKSLPDPQAKSRPDKTKSKSKSRAQDVSFMLRGRHVTGRSVHKIAVTWTIEGELELDDIHPGTESPQLEQRLADHPGARCEVVGRTCRPAGSFVALGKEQPGDPFWAEVYDGRFGHVYFGHQPYIGDEVRQFEHATGLDTGAVFGGSLSAAILEEEQPPSFMSVAATRAYAESYWD